MQKSNCIKEEAHSSQTPTTGLVIGNIYPGAGCLLPLPGCYGKIKKLISWADHIARKLIGMLYI